MTKDPKRRRCRPGLEGLEDRDLMSASALHAASERHQATPSLNLMVASETAAYGGVSSASLSNAVVGKSSGTPAWVNESYLQSLVSQLYGPVTTTTPITVGNQTFPPGTYSVPQPTAARVTAANVLGGIPGHLHGRCARFSNQSATIHIYSDGRSVTSNQFLNGRGQLLLFPPSDPTATPTTLDPVAGQVTGLMSLFAANILQSGSVLFAEMTNVPGVASNDPSGARSRLAVAGRVLDRPGWRIGRDLCDAGLHRRRPRP